MCLAQCVHTIICAHFALGISQAIANTIIICSFTIIVIFIVIVFMCTIRTNMHGILLDVLSFFSHHFDGEARENVVSSSSSSSPSTYYACYTFIYARLCNDINGQWWVGWTTPSREKERADGMGFSWICMEWRATSIKQLQCYAIRTFIWNNVYVWHGIKRNDCVTLLLNERTREKRNGWNKNKSSAHHLR